MNLKKLTGRIVEERAEISANLGVFFGLVVDVLIGVQWPETAGLIPWWGWWVWLVPLIVFGVIGYKAANRAYAGRQRAE